MFDNLDIQEGIGQPQDPQDKNKIPKEDLDFLTKKPSKPQIPDEDKQILTNPNLGTTTETKILDEDVPDSELTPEQREAIRKSNAQVQSQVKKQQTTQQTQQVDNRTDEQKKADLEDAQKKAYEKYLKSNRDAFTRIQMAKTSGGTVEPKDKEALELFKSQYRSAVGQNLNEARQKLYAEGYTTDAVAKKIPDSPRAGLVGTYEQNRRLEANGLNRQTMSPEVNAQGIINNFASAAFLKIEDLENFEGAELRRKASSLFYGYLGFDEQISDVATKAWELNRGNESLFVSLSSGKSVNSVFDLFESGDVRTGEDGDVTLYRDDRAEAIEYGLIAKIIRQAGIELTPENVASYAKKYQDLLATQKEEETRELREYAEKNLSEDQRGAFQKLWDGVAAIISPSSWNRDENAGNRGNLIKELLGNKYTEFQNYNESDVSTFGKTIVSDKKLDELARELTATRNYKIQLTEDSMYQAMANIPDIGYAEHIAPVLSYTLKTLYPEAYAKAMKDASNYLPSTQELGTFGAQLTAIVLGGAVGGGAGSTLVTLAMAEKMLRDSNPDTYNLNMAVQVLPVGIGNALNSAKPIIGSIGVGGLQIGLGAGQTITSYAINWESFKDEKGNVDLSRLFPELVLDTVSSGFDAPDFIAGIQAKRNVVPHQMMNMLVKTDAGDYAMFVKNPDSGIFQLVPVKADKAQAWAEKQRESGRPYIEQVMPVTEYNILMSKFGNESVTAALNHAVFGTSNPIRDLSAQFEKNSRVDSKQKIVDGEVVTTEKVNNPKMVIADEGAVPVKVDSRVARRLADTDENRDFSVLNILVNHGTTLNKNSNIIGDGKLEGVLTGLKDNGYITIDDTGNIRATAKGVEVTEKLNLAGESFQKFIDRNIENYGSKFDAQSKAEVSEAMKDNRFFEPSEKPFSYSIQDIMAMGQKQKEALAMQVAMGRAEFDRNTGVLKNTPFTLKDKDGNVKNFGRDKDAYVQWKTAKMEQAFSKGNDELGNAIAKDILDFQGKDSSPESIKKFVEGDPEAEEVKPVPVGSTPERSMGRKQAPETLVIEDALGHRRYFNKDSSGRWTKSGQQDQVFGGAYLKGLVDSGEWTLIGEAPRSWSETRTSTKENYKKSSSAVKQSRIPETLTREEADRIYADEGDVYNVAVWNQTAKEWREANPEKAKGGKNMRDYATVDELEVLDALEVMNSEYIKNGVDLPTRVVALNRKAIQLARVQEARKSVQKKLALPEKLSTKNKEKEVKALSELFSDNSESARGKYEELAKAIRSDDDIAASQILKDLVPESDNPTATLGRFYQASRNILQSNDFAMQADSIPNKIKNLLGLSPESKLGLTLLDHQKNFMNWTLTGGEIKLDPKTKIDIANPEWDADSAPHFEKSKADDGVIYVNNKLLSGLREAQGQSTGIFGLAFRSGADLIKKLDTYFPNNKDFQALKGAVEADKPFVLIKVDSQNMSYENFVDAVAHEGTHKLVIEAVGGTKLFNDESILANIFNHADGAILGNAVRNNSIYSGKSMNDVAHEVLAYATNPATLGGLGIRTVAEAQAFTRTYARLLNALADSYGEDAVKVITKFQEKQTKDTIRLIRENERRIRQNQLQANTEGLNISEGERAGQIRGYDDETSQQGFASTARQLDRLEGTGVKRLKVRRLTRDGNPFSLTGVGGAETSNRLREGGKPTFNFYVMREDGTFVVERDFKGSGWIAYDTEIEGNFADLAKEPELLKLYRETPFSTFQSVMEDLGYNGVFYYDSFSQGDVFNYRLQLFDNDINRQMIQGVSAFEMADKTAYQGSASPVPFTKFDSRFLLSGEGNMSFGAGHYLAQDKMVAEFYRRSYGKQSILFNGKDILSSMFSISTDNSEASLLRKIKLNLDTFPEYYSKNPNFLIDSIYSELQVKRNVLESKNDSSSAILLKIVNSDLNYIEDNLLEKANTIEFRKGTLIKAEIIPDLDSFLDLDKKIGEQPKLQQTLVDYLDNTNILTPDVMAKLKSGDMRAYYLIKALETGIHNERVASGNLTDPHSKKNIALSQVEASKLLLQMGIRGNKFLDGNNRKKGTGTKNYVVFHDDDAKIVATAKDVSEFEMDGIRKKLAKSETWKKWAGNTVMVDENGLPILLNHGTRSSVVYDKPDTARSPIELGFHLGTIDQSNKFVLNDKSIQAYGVNPDLSTDVFGDYLKIAKSNEIEIYSKILGYPDEIVKYIVGDTDVLDLDSVKILQKDKAKFGSSVSETELVNKLNTQRKLTLPVINRKDRIDIYVANFKNSITLEDTGAWDSVDLLGQMFTNNLIDGYEYQEMLNSFQEVYSNNVGNPDESMLIVRNKFVEFLKDLGYDSVKYWNKYEAEGWSYIALDADQLRPAFDPEFADPMVAKIREQEEFMMAQDSTPEQRTNNLMKYIYNTPPEKLAVKDVSTLIRDGFWSTFTSVKGTDASNQGKLKDELIGLGYKVVEVDGRYSGVNEPAFMVYYQNPNTSRIIQALSNKYDQESALHGKAGQYWLEYQDGSTRIGSNITLDGVETTSIGTKLQEGYAKKKGLKVDVKNRPYMKAPEPEVLQKIADARTADPHTPDDPEVQKAYQAFFDETNDQYDYLLKSGIKVEAWEGQGEPYKGSKDMIRDITENNHFYYLKTESAFGTGQLETKGFEQSARHLPLGDSGRVDSNGRQLPYNDVFRIVHDLMGHTGNQWQFGVRGEWNAFASHAELYSDAALPALMAESFTQNSVIAMKNYKYENGEYKLAVKPENIEFAEQKSSIPSKEIQDLIKSELEKSFKSAVESGKDGTFVKLKDGTVRFSVDFDWSDEAVVPRASNYDLEPAERRIQVRDELKNSDILTPDQMSRIWNGEAELVDAKGDKIDLNDVYDSTGRKVGKVEIDDTGQEYVMDGKTKVNLVNGTGKRGVTNYYVGKTGRDILATTGMFQQLVKLYSPYDQLVKPDNPDGMASYNAQRSEIYKANIKSILDQYSKSHESEMGGLWYRSGIDDLALKVGKDIKAVSTDIGKLWLALVTAVTSPNTSVQVNAGYALNALSSIFRYYESGELVIPKFQMDNQGNYIVKADGTPKKLGLGSAQLEKIEMLIKGYVPADTAEGWSQYYANGGKVDTVTGRDVLGENSIAPRAKYVKSATASEMMNKYGSLNGVINFLLSESVDGKKFNKAVDILGDKLGAFFSNIAGQTQIPTIDTWMNRYFMGLTGEALEITRDKNGNITKIKDNSQNFDPRDGDFFRATIQKAVQEWNAENGGKITPADAQAIIWTQIKDLYNSMADKESANIDFSQAYDKIRMQKVINQPLLPMFGDAEFKSEMPKSNAFDIDPTDINPKYLDPKFGENFFIEQDTGMTFAMAEKSPFETTAQRLELSDELLKEGDIDTWTSLANMLVQGGMHSSEQARLESYLNKGDIDGAKKYILSLNKMGVMELFVNIGRIALLLGVKNIAKNIGGNSLRVFMDEVSSLPTSILDLALIQVNKLAGGENFDRARISLVTDPVASLRMYKEAFGAGVTKGLKDSYDTFTGKHATNFEHPAFSRERTTGWRLLKPLEIFERYGWRFQGALDRPFNALAYQKSISELQTLRQKEQVKAGNKISYEEAKDYLTPQDYELSEYRALAASYQDHNRVANKYYSFVEGLPPFWRAVSNNVFKFVKTPLNVVDYMLDYTGFWQIAKMADAKHKSEDFTTWKAEVKKILDNPQDRLTLSKAISQGMLGSVMIHIGFRMAQEGIIQGFYDPDEKKEQDIMEAKNISYGSIQIGGKNVDISWLSPVAFYLLAGGSMFHDGKKYSEKLGEAENKVQYLKDTGASEDAIKTAEQDLAKIQGSSPSQEVITRILKNLALQTPFLRQGYDLVKATEQDKLGEGVLNMLVQPESFVPAIMKEVAETTDTTGRVLRDDSWANKANDKVQAKVPTIPVVKDIGKALEDTNLPVVRGAGRILQGREALPVKYDMLGRPIETPYGLDPFRTEKVDESDPLIKELEAFKITIPKPTKGTSIEKNDERKARGDFYRPQLEKIISSEEYNRASDVTKQETLRDAMRYLGTAKREKIKEEYVNHKVNLIRDVNYMIGDISTNPSKYAVKEITDKESVMHIHRANIDPKKLNPREIVNSMGGKELDEFFNDMFRHNFEPNDKRTLEEAKANYEKFKSNPNEFIVQQYIRDLEYKNRRERLANWRKELKDAGKTDKEIDSEIRSRSSKLGKQTGYKYRRNGKITIPESLAERMIQNQRPSENIEDRR